jgi:hypothetical protein
MIPEQECVKKYCGVLICSFLFSYPKGLIALWSLKNLFRKQALYGLFLGNEQKVLY